jgi:hypothetical protein
MEELQLALSETIQGGGEFNYSLIYIVELTLIRRFQNGRKSTPCLGSSRQLPGPATESSWGRHSVSVIASFYPFRNSRTTRSGRDKSWLDFNLNGPAQVLGVSMFLNLLPRWTLPCVPPGVNVSVDADALDLPGSSARLSAPQNAGSVRRLNGRDH